MTDHYRHELKYLISSDQIPVLRSRLNILMSPDDHALRDSGMYSVRSLYFDDYDNHCFYENENGTDPREKYRIRIYNHSSERISLECKRKENGKTQKNTCDIAMEQVVSSIHSTLAFDPHAPVLLRKLMVLMAEKLYHPVVIVEYDRIPYICRNGNVRITFDLNISSSSAISQFFSDRIPRRPIMPAGMHLLEVKFDDYLPDPIYHVLNLGSLRQTSFSKFYLCRKYALRRQ